MEAKVYAVQRVERPVPVRVCVPGSKSITNRALLIAALAPGRSRLTGVLFSDDSRHFLQALSDLGFSVDIDEAGKCVEILGCGGAIPKREAEIDVGSAGTAARFLTALLALSEGRYRLNSSEQMKKRPMKELLTVLEGLGASFEFEEEPYHFPFTVERRKRDSLGEPVQLTVDVDKSSQFLSALLMVSVLFAEGAEISVTGEHGMAYVDMTVTIMEQFGMTVDVSVEQKGTETTHSTGRRYRIRAGASYQAREYPVEPDLSAACYFYGAGMLLGVPAKVVGTRMDSMQGDMAFLKVMEDLGGKICPEADGICLLPAGGNDRRQERSKAGSGEKEPESAGMKLHVPREHAEGWDLSAFSDQALTLAALAPFADAPVSLREIGHIRYQECDRIHAIRENLKAMGVKTEEEEGTLRIFPPERAGEIHGARIRTFEDHRVAMAFSLPGLVLDGQIIENPGCCAKTFENFFEVLESIGTV